MIKRPFLDHGGCAPSPGILSGNKKEAKIYYISVIYVDPTTKRGRYFTYDHFILHSSILSLFIDPRG
jgi:hypothetical protein